MDVENDRTTMSDGLPPVEPELNPAFDILRAPRLTTPLVLSSPHSGSIYPAAFLAASRLDPLSLRRSEDAFVDGLVMGAVADGAPLIRALFPRAYVDLNREPYELDPRMFDGRLPPQANTRSARVAGGLGVIARVVADAQEIYPGRLPVSEAIRRIEGLHKPWHDALRALLNETWATFGLAVLLDCHSMPSAQALAASERGDRRPVDMVIGDRYGASCDVRIVAALEAILTRLGYRIARNRPYAGGYITEQYGAPALGVHALQIEINRGLYMDEQRIEPRPGFSALATDLALAIRALSDWLLDDRQGAAWAAE